VGLNLFGLQNPGFDGSLRAWQARATAPASTGYSSEDVNGGTGSGAAQLSGAGPSTVSLSQCVRTSEGAEYALGARARALSAAGGDVALDLGVRFYAGP